VRIPVLKQTTLIVLRVYCTHCDSHVSKSTERRHRIGATAPRLVAKSVYASRKRPFLDSCSEDDQSSSEQSGDEAEVGSPQADDGVDNNNDIDEYQQEGFLDAELSMMSLYDDAVEPLSDSLEQSDGEADINIEEILNASRDRRYGARVDDDDDSDHEAESDPEDLNNMFWPWDNTDDDDVDELVGWDLGEDFEKEAAELGEFKLDNADSLVDCCGP